MFIIGATALARDAARRYMLGEPTDGTEIGDGVQVAIAKA